MYITKNELLAMARVAIERQRKIDIRHCSIVCYQPIKKSAEENFLNLMHLMGYRITKKQKYFSSVEFIISW